MLKELLKKSILKQLKAVGNPSRVRLELSGGCDSVSLFFCLLDLGIDFDCHTYYYKSGYDYKKAREIADKYGVKHTLYPITENDIDDYERELLAEGYPKKKTILECLIGHKPIAEALKDSVVMNGSYADILWAAYFSIRRKARGNLESLKVLRMGSLYGQDVDGTKSLSKLFAKNNNKVIYPYYDLGVIDFFLKLPIEALGRKKALFKEEFSKELGKIKVHRASQQIVSGIRDYRRLKKIIRK